jgi:transposase
MRTKSMDMRERVVVACDEGIDTRAESAARFSVRESWVRRLLQRRREIGSLQRKPHSGGWPTAFDGDVTGGLRRGFALPPSVEMDTLEAKISHLLI